MTLHEILCSVRIGDIFYRESLPDIIYERTGAVIECDGLPWASINCCGDWEIPGCHTDNDWTLVRQSIQKDFDPKKRPPILKPCYTEKNRHGWTYYDLPIIDCD